MVLHADVNAWFERLCEEDPRSADRVAPLADRRFDGYLTEHKGKD